MKLKMRAMKRWKRWTLLVLGLVILSQLPFVYRRFELRRLRASIQELDARARSAPPDDSYHDYKGVVHVHSQLGGHSTGTFAEIIKAAQANRLAFVVMTEHPSSTIDTAAATLKDFHQDILFINGNEVSASGGSDRLLVLPGTAESSAANTRPAQEIAARAKEQGRLAIVAYPQDFRSWDAAAYDGVEVYNLYTNARRINPLIMFFDGLWSYGSYADLLFARFYERPTESLRLWDEQTVKNRRLAGVAGNDAHQNVGLNLGDAGGNKYLQILLDPYERSFRIVRTHALIPKDEALSAEALLASIRSGHAYIAFDLFADATGFRFTAHNASEKKVMGDAIALQDGVRLEVHAPVPSRIVLFRNGSVQEAAPDATSKEFQVGERGVYRVEVYLDQLGSSFRDRPWIISNPIYVE